MTNPTIQKTWEFDLNHLVFSNTTLAGNAHQDRREMLFGIKQSLTNNGDATFTSPWTVVSSSNSSTASAADNWSSISDLVWRDDDTASAFSWIVLRQTGVSTTFELLITCEQDANTQDGARIGAWVAQAGFTGGTTTARPTATDERQIRDSTASGHWGSGSDGGTPSPAYRWHIMMSSDGDCTRVLMFVDTVNTGFWIFDVPDNPATGWTNPYVAAILGFNDFTTNACRYASWLDVDFAKSRFSGTDTTLFFSSEGFADSAIGELLTTPDQLDDTYVASEMGLSSQTSTFTGRMGTLFDLWWGFTFVPTGRYYPDTGTKLYVHVHHMIFPWDGSTLLQTR